MNSVPLFRYKEMILIVDDSNHILKLLSTMLESQGYSVELATSGRLALKSLELLAPDLVLLDINMPGMDGYRVCETIKSMPHYHSTPVIFISASDQVLNKVKAFQVGAIDYITKPFHLEEVLIRVENQLNQKRLYQELQRQNSLLKIEIEERLRVEKALKEANHKLHLLASLDGLTGIANRRRFDEYMAAEWQRCSRGNFPLSLILIDVDFFKLYNDTYGHLSGDDCLKQVALTLQGISKRATDMVARYGGEEFVVVLPHTPLEGAQEVAEKIQMAIAAQNIPHAQSSVAEHITVSIGVANMVPRPDTPLAEFIHRADQALYQAKLNGRNQIAFSPFVRQELTI